MNDIKTSLQILIDSLKQKRECLEKIKSHSSMQEQLLKLDSMDEEAFSLIIKEKQGLIDKIVVLDNGFKPMYERIQGALQQQPDFYKEEINTMKLLIKEIGEESVTVQVLERRNKIEFDMKTATSKEKVKTFKKSKQAVSNYYSSMNKQKNSEGTFFFDTKK